MKTLLETAREFLQEGRPLLVAATVDPCYKEAGRERARDELARLASALLHGSTDPGALEACRDPMLDVVVLSSFGTSPKARGFSGRVRRFAETTWPADYTVQPSRGVAHLDRGELGK